MKFFEWTTDYQLYKRQFASTQRHDFEKFCSVRARELRSEGVMPVRLYAERDWRLNNYPYYNIHPQLVPKLCKVDLHKIPSKMLKMPHGLQTVLVRFAQQHREFTIDDELTTDPQDNQTYKIPAGSFLHGVMMCKNQNNADDGGVIFVLDFRVNNEHEQPVYNSFRIVPTDTTSMEECIGAVNVGKRGESFQKMVYNVIKLVVTIGFLSDNPTICEADVLAADKAKFDRGTDNERLEYAKRAVRRGKYGWNIGNDLMFLGERPKGEQRVSAQTGRELEYAHIRGGHPHAVRYGSSKSFVKIMWYSPIVVKEDLPFKLEDR